MESLRAWAVGSWYHYVPHAFVPRFPEPAPTKLQHAHSHCSEALCPSIATLPPPYHPSIFRTGSNSRALMGFSRLPRHALISSGHNAGERIRANMSSRRERYACPRGRAKQRWKTKGGNTESNKLPLGSCPRTFGARSQIPKHRKMLRQSVELPGHGLHAPAQELIKAKPTTSCCLPDPPPFQLRKTGRVEAMSSTATAGLGGTLELSGTDSAWRTRCRS